MVLYDIHVASKQFFIAAKQSSPPLLLPLQFVDAAIKVRDDYRITDLSAELLQSFHSIGEFILSDQQSDIEPHHILDDWLLLLNELLDWEDWQRTSETDLKPFYCGPGLWYDRTTGHIHARLAHTHLPPPTTR